MSASINAARALRLYAWLKGTTGMNAGGYQMARMLGLTHGSSNFKAVINRMYPLAAADGYCMHYPDWTNGYTYGLTVNPDSVISNLVHLDQTERGVRRVKKAKLACVLSKHPTGDTKIVAEAMQSQIIAIEKHDKKARKDLRPTWTSSSRSTPSTSSPLEALAPHHLRVVGALGPFMWKETHELELNRLTPSSNYQRGNALMTLTRRTFLSGTAAVALLPLTPSAQAVTPIQFGVNVHSSFRKSLYNRDTDILNAADRTGAVRIRDSLASVFNQAALYDRYANAGMTRVHVAVGTYDRTDRAALQRRMAESRDHIVEVAGWNEPEYDRGKGPRPRNVWLPRVVENQKWLYHTAKATIPGVKVCLGALRNVAQTFPQDLTAMMNACDGYYDLVNLHMYPGNVPNVAQYIDGRVALAHGRKVVITEFGGSTFNVSEARQATIIREGLLWAKAHNVWMDIYQLMDYPGSSLQDRFGVYRSNFSAKPAVAVMRGLA